MAGAISQPRQSSQFLFCLMKNPLLYRSAWPESGREVRERFLMETLGRTQSERRRRLALAGGFRLLRSSGIDRLDAPAHSAGRGSLGPDACDSARYARLESTTPELPLTPKIPYRAGVKSPPASLVCHSVPLSSTSRPQILSLWTKFCRDANSLFKSSR